MSNLSQFVGSSLLRTPNALIGKPTAAKGCVGLSAHALLTLSGAMTATVYKDVVDVTGAGVLNFAACSVVDTTARDIAIKVTLDGTQVIELTAAGVATTDNGLVAVGCFDDDTVNSVAADMLLFEDIPYHVSLKVSIKSSLTETDKMNWFAVYRTIA